MQSLATRTWRQAVSGCEGGYLEVIREPLKGLVSRFRNGPRGPLGSATFSGIALPPTEFWRGIIFELPVIQAQSLRPTRRNNST
jgi:hypothetical protein